MGPQCPSQVCAARFSGNVVLSRICKSLPGISPRSRKKCKNGKENEHHRKEKKTWKRAMLPQTEAFGADSDVDAVISFDMRSIDHMRPQMKSRTVGLVEKRCRSDVIQSTL